MSRFFMQLLDLSDTIEFFEHNALKTRLEALEVQFGGFMVSSSLGRAV